MFKSISWTINTPWEATPACQTFSSLEAVFALAGTPISKDKESVVFSLEIEGKRYYVKRYHTSKGIRSWLGRARIRMEALNLLWFDRIGIPTAKVVAYGEEHFFCKTFRGAMITASVDNSKDLRWLALNKPEYINNSEWLDKVISQLADITRALHQNNFCHNDLKWRNILVTEDLNNPKVYLIDCPVGQKIPAPLRQRRIIKDLACLDKVAKYQLSRTKRLCFFKRYRQLVRLSPKDKRTIKRTLSYFEGRE